MTKHSADGWNDSDAYDTYMGRWSRPVARAFIEWLRPRGAAHWLDVGCGTGALTSTICQLCDPASVVGCDPSGPFIEDARSRFADERAFFVRGTFDNLPTRQDGFHTIASGLVLNLAPRPDQDVASMLDRLRQGGLMAAYVWDYAEGMMFLRYFWDEAIVIDSSASDLDEGRRFPLCRPDALKSLFQGAGLHSIETQALKIRTDFRDFDDYWLPFLGGTGPAPAFVRNLAEDRREKLRNRLLKRIPSATDGSIKLSARAWAVRGIAP